MMGTFLWWGQLERVAMEVLYNGEKDGGIELVDLEAKALLARSAIRLVCSGDPVSQEVGKYHFGQRLPAIWETLTGRKLDPGPRVEHLPPYFKGLAELLEEVVVPG